MPTMVRAKGKGKQIAYSLLGIPANLLYKKSRKEKKRQDSLFLQQSRYSSKIF